MDSETFRNRLVELCLSSGMTGLPRNPEDRLLLLRSVVLTLDRDARYNEKQLDDLLISWLTHVGTSITLNHVNPRRRLIDEGLLECTRDGAHYWVVESPTATQLFDASVENCDPYEAIRTGRTARGERKLAFRTHTVAF